MNVVHYLVKKDDFSVRRWSESPLPEEIAEGEILLRIDKFAFTANNLSYATDRLLEALSNRGGLGAHSRLGFCRRRGLEV
jgi:hypothetical protein